MDGLSTAGSAIAVVSLVIQLVETVQEINRFLKSVHEAPKEVLNLSETLDQLQGTLDNVRLLIETQYLVLRLPGSPALMTRAIENCEKQIKALEAFASTARKSLEHQHGLRKRWASMRIVTRKQDVEDIQCRLRDAKIDLQFALSSNSWQLQMYHIQNTVPIVHRIQQAQSVSNLHYAPGRNTDEISSEHELSILHSTKPMKHPCPSTKQEHVTWYGGIFGSMTLEKKSKYSKSSANAKWERPLITEMAWTFRPSFIRYAIQLRYARSFGYVPPSLNIYPVLSTSDTIFQRCKDGNLLGLQTALSRNGISPFVVDSNGWTLLHYAAAGPNFELSNWLLQVGLNADAADHSGLKALHYVIVDARQHLQDRLCLKQNFINTLRILAQHQGDVSDYDLSVAVYGYGGPPEGVDLLLSYSSSHIERFEMAAGSDYMPPLALVLKCYNHCFFWENLPENDESWQIPRTALSSERKSWELLLRRLIHKGADLHVRVPYNDDHSGNYSPSHVNEYATLLDVLFQYSGTPDEARKLGDEWLGLLASEGHDVVTYLKEEMLLHASQHQMTYPIISPLRGQPLALRELQFMFDNGRPSVWWEWWIDPCSDIDLLDREFKEMVKTQYVGLSYRDCCLSSPWPFRYPIWHQVFEGRIHSWSDTASVSDKEISRRACLALQRANRRLQKRHAKNTRSRGLRYPQMPGAWQA